MLPKHYCLRDFWGEVVAQGTKESVKAAAILMFFPRPNQPDREGALEFLLEEVDLEEVNG